jgi:hypothetical protein
MSAVYQPQPETIAERAIEYLEKALDRKPKGAWIPNLAVCTALGVKPNAIRPSLDKAIAVGLVERSICPSGFTQWRLGYIKPRRRPTKPQPAEVPKFSIDWPPGFVSKFDTVKVPDHEQRRK